MLRHARLCAAVFTAADIKLRSPLLPTVSSSFSTKKLIFASRIRTCNYTANIYSGNWDTRKKSKSYKYLP